MSQEIHQKQLSIILISYNCVVNLKECLSSVQAIADEIVVVDAQSTDGTAD